MTTIERSRTTSSERIHSHSATITTTQSQDTQITLSNNEAIEPALNIQQQQWYRKKGSLRLGRILFAVIHFASSFANGNYLFTLLEISIVGYRSYLRRHC